MATVIRANCGFCGDVRLQASEVTIRTRVNVPGGEYRWKCKCGIVVKQAEDYIIQVLRQTIGVNEEVWELPLELMEHPIDGTLSEDGIIDLELAFQNNSLYEKITKKHQS